MNAYSELEARKKRISALTNAMGILHWDQQTMMPDGAAPAAACDGVQRGADDPDLAVAGRRKTCVNSVETVR